jgi:hypothetical protein
VSPPGAILAKASGDPPARLIMTQYHLLAGSRRRGEMNIYGAKTARFFALGATTALGLTLTTGTAALADPNADLIGPGPGYVNAPTAVECVQKALGLSQDGQFGQDTYDAVRNFQARNDLLNDGIVGPATGNLLLNSVPSSWNATCYSWLPTTFSRA